MDEDDKLRILERSLMEAVASNWNFEDLEPKVFSEKFMELFERVREDCEASSLEGYKDKAPELLADIREATAGFESRSFARWKPSFDHLEMMWSIAQELGEMHGKAIQADDGEDKNPVMGALGHIFPRALLVTQEVICLLKGGFPDGALARWRSLHELTVTAMYIAKHGNDAATSYLLSFNFAARRAALQMNEHSERAQIGSFSDDELKEFDARCAGAEEILGRKIKKDKHGEWPAITQTHTNFAALEKDVEMDHWRPRYKWASTHTHAHHRPIDKLLGMVEAEKEVHLVGASNSGFVDPFQMTAISLAQITMTYLFHAVNVDRIVHANIMHTLADQMSTIAIENERVTREAFEAQKE
ncbi:MULTISPECIES: DUF5677 domain-containing protein [unclassified Phaeobacter]|uniref:DUF5677 domain-containing protein n=1 Tax=unclassified Phaeobacter TaxID=2621772 RepID=UPI003A8B6860